MPYAITNRIVKALHSKDTSEKARLLESVVAMNYKEWRVFHELGKAYAELGNQEKARKYFLQALECKAGDKYKQETAAELGW